MIAKLGEKQTILEAVLVMAYNAGRAHAKSNGEISIEDGRMMLLKALLNFIEDIDPGDLANPVNTLVHPRKGIGFDGVERGES